jgi:hypothetical protein
MTRRWCDPADAEHWLPQPIWPAALKRPESPPPVLFLDLNHWIELARADAGKGAPAHVRLLATLRRAVTADAVTIVLTSGLYREIIKIKDPKQRQSLTNLIAELSGPRYLPGLTDIFLAELSTALDATTGTTGTRYQQFDLVGTSALHALGKVGGLRVIDGDGVDRTAEYLTNTPGFAARFADANAEAERMLLAGPTDADVPRMRAEGYAPERPEQAVRDNAAFEAGWSKQIDPYRKSRNIRDLVIARHLALELLDMLEHERALRQFAVEDVVTPVAARNLVMSMPSNATMVSMLAEYHHNPQKTWMENDIYDIHTLAAAVPYCDIVLTDAAARDALTRRHVHEWLNTEMPRRAENLSDSLDPLLHSAA